MFHWFISIAFSNVSIEHIGLVIGAIPSAGSIIARSIIVYSYRINH